MATLKILHISDLHFSRDSEWDSSQVLSKAGQRFHALCESGLRPDLIAITGDLANHGLQAEYDLLQKWLDQVFLGPGSLEFDAKSLLIIPGNHDVDRNGISSGAHSIQRDLWNIATQEQVASVLKDSHDRATMLRRHGNYLTFLSRLYSRDVTEPWWCQDYHFAGHKLGLVGLCSSWVSHSKDDKGKLIVGRYQFSCVEDCVRDSRFNIALVHHPIDYLHDFDSDHTLIRFQNEYDLVLSGHLHSQSATSRVNPDNDYLELAAGALYAGSSFPNAFQLIELDLTTREARVHFYSWHKQQWIPDKNAYQSAPNGVATFQLANTPTEIPDRAADPLDESREDEFQEPSARVDFGIQTEPTILDAPPAVDVAMTCLATVPRFQGSFDKQHEAVRQMIRSEAETHLRKGRIIWVAADWGVGRRPFLGSLISRLTQRDWQPPIFQLNCDNIKTADDLLDAFPQQFALTLQQFCRWAGVLKQAFLVFEDLHSTVLNHGGNSESRIYRIVKTVLEYCPTLHILAVSRTKPSSDDDIPCVELGPLDQLEIRDYLAAHSRHPVNIDEWETLDRIAAATGGLPRNLDSFVEGLQVASLTEVLASLSVEPYQGDSDTGELPQSLVQQILRLKNSSEEDSKRSYRLLLALSALDAGEPLHIIKRTYPEAPFWEKHAKALMDLSLLEASPLALNLTSNRDIRRSTLEAQKLLRVPRAIREYVVESLSESEHYDVVCAAARALFGKDWRHGKIRLIDRDTTTEYGPGNEHSLCSHLIRHAITKRDETEIRLCLTVALKYLSRLYASHRYRDGYVASHEILTLMDQRIDGNSGFEKEIAELRFYCARFARMISHWQEAVDQFSIILGSSSVDKNKTRDAELYLDLALAHQSLGASADAIAAARRVCELATTDTARHMQAKTIILECEKEGDELDVALQRLETRARNRGFATVADNITLSRIHSCRDTDRVEQYTAKVLSGDGNDYNKLRARLRRVNALLDAGRPTDVNAVDRRWLERGYNYLFDQRMNSLFDECHNALWRLYRVSCDRTSLLKLFRNSSFLWRLRGEEDNEEVWATELAGLEPNKLEESNQTSVRVELRYFFQRIIRYVKEGVQGT